MIAQVTGYSFEMNYLNISNSFSSVISISVPSKTTIFICFLQQTSLQYILDEHNKVRQDTELQLPTGFYYSVPIKTLSQCNGYVPPYAHGVSVNLLSKNVSFISL